MEQSVASKVIASVIDIMNEDYKKTKDVEKLDVVNVLYAGLNRLTDIEFKIKDQPSKNGMLDENKLLKEERENLITYLNSYFKTIKLFNNSSIFFEPFRITYKMMVTPASELEFNIRDIYKLSEYMESGTYQSGAANYLWKRLKKNDNWLGILEVIDNPETFLLAACYYCDPEK